MKTKYTDSVVINFGIILRKRERGIISEEKFNRLFVKLTEWNEMELRK